MIDWTAIGVALTALASLCGLSVMWGVNRTQVMNLQTELAALDKRTHDHLGDQDARLDKLEAAITKATEVGHSVDLLRGEVRSANQLITSQQVSAEKMAAERFEGLRGEVRAFMTGQAEATARSNRAATRRAS